MVRREKASTSFFFCSAVSCRQWRPADYCVMKFRSKVLSSTGASLSYRPS